MNVQAGGPNVYSTTACSGKRAVAEKNVQLAGVGERVKKLEKQRVVLLLAILVCACVSVGVLFR